MDYVVVTTLALFFIVILFYFIVFLTWVVSGKVLLPKFIKKKFNIKDEPMEEGYLKKFLEGFIQLIVGLMVMGLIITIFEEHSGKIVPVLLGIIALGIFISLVMQRWFWLLIFGLGGLASCFAMIASVIHFQIFGAVGFFILMFILWGITSFIAEG